MPWVCPAIRRVWGSHSAVQAPRSRIRFSAAGTRRPCRRAASRTWHECSSCDRSECSEIPLVRVRRYLAILVLAVLRALATMTRPCRPSTIEWHEGRSCATFAAVFVRSQTCATHILSSCGLLVSSAKKRVRSVRSASIPGFASSSTRTARSSREERTVAFGGVPIFSSCGSGSASSRATWLRYAPSARGTIWSAATCQVTSTPGNQPADNRLLGLC